MSYTAIVTDKGNEVIADALTNGTAISFSQFVVGDGGGSAVTPTASQTALVNQVWSGDVESFTKSGGVLTVKGMIPKTDGGFTVREMGVTDRDGNLLCVAGVPDVPKTASGNVLNALTLTISIAIANVDTVSFELENGGYDTSYYGVCSTAAATKAKVVACDDYALATGSHIFVKFSKANTVAGATLNVNNTGAKAIYQDGAAIATGTILANSVYEFVYDGTNYNLIGVSTAAIEEKIAEVEDSLTEKSEVGHKHTVDDIVTEVTLTCVKVGATGAVNYTWRYVVYSADAQLSKAKWIAYFESISDGDGYFNFDIGGNSVTFNLSEISTYAASSATDYYGIDETVTGLRLSVYNDVVIGFVVQLLCDVTDVEDNDADSRTGYLTSATVGETNVVSFYGLLSAYFTLTATSTGRYELIDDDYVNVCSCTPDVTMSLAKAQVLFGINGIVWNGLTYFPDDFVFSEDIDSNSKYMMVADKGKCCVFYSDGIITEFAFCAPTLDGYDWTCGSVGDTKTVILSSEQIRRIMFM